MMPTLPQDIITVILLMLPTKSLLVFWNVCRAWRDIIRDPVFIKRHFQSRASKGNSYLLYAPLEHRNYDRAFRLLCDRSFDEALDIEFPVELRDVSFIVVGSCNGLLCLTNTDSYGTVIYLCNPFIRKCRTINIPITGLLRSSEDCLHVHIALGFGYFDQTDDYKIVRIALSSEIDMVKIEVYSMITDLWRDIEVDYFPWEVIETRPEALVCDSIHWKAISGDTDEDVMVILAFHLGEELFRQINFPDYGADGSDFVEFIGVFKGHLSVFLFRLMDEHPDYEKCYLWVMNEYGVESSWTKMYSITVASGVMSPIIFTRNDEIIFEDGDFDLNVYRFDSSTLEYLGVEEQGHLNLVTYTDSLVLLEG